MKNKIRNIKINDRYENGSLKHNVNTKAKNPTHSILGLNKFSDYKQVELVLSEARGLFIGGLSPRAKSNMVDSMLISMTSHATPNELGIVLMTSNDENKYRNLPHLLTDPIINVEDGLLYLEYLLELIDDRELALKKTQANNIEDYNEIVLLENIEEFWNYSVIFIDGYESYKSESDKIDEYIKQISDRGERIGVSVVVISERVREKVNTLITKPFAEDPLLHTVLSYNKENPSAIRVDGKDLHASIEQKHIREFHINLIVNELCEKYPKRKVDLFKEYKTLKGDRSEFLFKLELLDEDEDSTTKFVSNGFADLLKNTF